MKQTFVAMSDDNILPFESHIPIISSPQNLRDASYEYNTNTTVKDSQYQGEYLGSYGKKCQTWYIPVDATVHL